MISFNNLGRYGKLGNQMFQYATLMNVADKLGVSCCAPVSNAFSIGGCFSLGSVEDKVSENVSNVFMEKGFWYQDSVFELDPSVDSDIIGYFQSEKYFSRIEDLIRKEFVFKDEVLKSTKNVGAEDKVALHIRRGDYMYLTDVHPVQDKDYYLEAMSHFPDSQFLIFSDDINWCRNADLFRGGEENGFHFAEGNQYQDLYSMSKCRGHIIANSSYSWWGSWLSENSEKTIAPKDWFGPKGPIEWQDVYCDGWVVI